MPWWKAYALGLGILLGLIGFMFGLTWLAYRFLPMLGFIDPSWNAFVLGSCLFVIVVSEVIRRISR